MSVLTGERVEWRRILHEGRPEWTQPDGDYLTLADGRSVLEAEATYLPPCDPTKILCIHLNYESRRIEFKAPELITPTYFQKPTTGLPMFHMISAPYISLVVLRGKMSS